MAAGVAAGGGGAAATPLNRKTVPWLTFRDWLPAQQLRRALSWGIPRWFHLKRHIALGLFVIFPCIMGPQKRRKVLSYSLSGPKPR
jgi:hypothetical protein